MIASKISLVTNHIRKRYPIILSLLNQCYPRLCLIRMVQKLCFFKLCLQTFMKLNEHLTHTYFLLMPIPSTSLTIHKATHYHMAFNMQLCNNSTYIKNKFLLKLVQLAVPLSHTLVKTMLILCFNLPTAFPFQ